MPQEKEDKDYEFNDLFIPLTTRKVIIFLSLIGFFVFFNALSGAFVWDDLSYIQFNPDVHTLDLINLFKANSFNHSAGQYRALTATYFASLYSLFGNNTFFYHFLQLVLHTANTILLFFLFRKFFSINIAFFLSVIFLIHPMQVESVAFIGSSGNVLLFFLGITAVFLLHKERYRRKPAKLLLVFFLLLLSLLAKETGAVFLLLAMIAPFLFLWKKKKLFLLYGLGVVSIYLLIRFGVGGVYLEHDALSSLIPITNLTFAERILNMPAIFFYYISTFVFPYRLVIDQLWVITAVDLQQFYIPLFISSIFLLASLGFGSFLYKKKSSLLQGYIFFLLWFLFGIGIHLQIVPLDMTVADRWFYVPIAGLLGMIGVAMSTIHVKKYRKVIITVGVCIIIVLSIRAIVRNANWVDNMTLFSHDTPLIENYEMENNLASFYAMQGKSKDALIHSQKSVALY
ncbi:MAG: hypothetical protein ACREHC_05005, partial [Candidatus Levyibacteriota bacterium]